MPGQGRHGSNAVLPNVMQSDLLSPLGAIDQAARQACGGVPDRFGFW